jgi:hypothetical protein
MLSEPNLRDYAALSLMVDLISVPVFLRVVRLWWRVYAHSSPILQVLICVSVADTLLLLCFITTDISRLVHAPLPSGRLLSLSVRRRDS